MNLGAMLELFGLFSDQTALQVRRQLMKFLNITKKRGADDCALLKKPLMMKLLYLHYANNTIATVWYWPAQKYGVP